MLNKNYKNIFDNDIDNKILSCSGMIGILCSFEKRLGKLEETILTVSQLIFILHLIL
jgi:hypothetical protein